MFQRRRSPSNVCDALKRIRGMTSILVFTFVVKQRIPQIMILFISEFSKKNFINISMNPQKTQTTYLYT